MCEILVAIYEIRYSVGIFEWFIEIIDSAKLTKTIDNINYSDSAPPHSP